MHSKERPRGKISDCIHTPKSCDVWPCCNPCAAAFSLSLTAQRKKKEGWWSWLMARLVHSHLFLLVYALTTLFSTPKMILV